MDERSATRPPTSTPGQSYVPPIGIYATALTVWDPGSEHAGACWPAVTSIGKNPTFTGVGAPTTVETYALDQDLGDSLYDQQVEVAFIERLRGEQAFEGVDALVAQIDRDVEQARPLLSEAAMQAVLRPPPELGSAS